MRAPHPTQLAWALFAAAIGSLIAALVLAALNGFENSWGWGTDAGVFFACASGIAFPLVGALIASRHPRNTVGWICLAIGLGLGVTTAATEYARFAIETDPGALPAGELVASLANWDWLLWVGPLLIHFVLFFPDGRPPSARWRVVAWLGAGAIALAAVSEALSPTFLDEYPTVRNPVGVEGAEGLLEAAGSLAYLVFLPCVLASGASMVLRLRRARGVERQQLKWFAFAAAVLATLFVPVCVLTILAPAYDQTAQGTLIVQDLMTLVFAAPALAAGIAILRYRLYDIDVVINRTLVYGALTATLAGVYLASVLVLQLALSGVTEGSSLAVAASTLGVAALFRPARVHIQELVDRRFYRRKYDAARTLESFGARVRDEVALDSLSAELRGVVAETMQPAHMSLWLRGGAR